MYPERFQGKPPKGRNSLVISNSSQINGKKNTASNLYLLINIFVANPENPNWKTLNASENKINKGIATKIDTFP